MKVAVLLVVCFASLVSSDTLGAPGHRDECYDPSAFGGEKYGKLGESWMTAGCKLATCELRKNYLGQMVPWMKPTACKTVTIAPYEKCRRAAGDKRKQYPDCCPKKQCIVDGRKVTLTVTEY